jgi:hypothetical protein
MGIRNVMQEAGSLEHSVTSQKMNSARFEVVPNGTTLPYCSRIACSSNHTNLPCSIFGPAVAALFPRAFYATCSAKICLNCEFKTSVKPKSKIQITHIKYNFPKL